MSRFIYFTERLGAFSHHLQMNSLTHNVPNYKEWLFHSERSEKLMSNTHSSFFHCAVFRLLHVRNGNCKYHLGEETFKLAQSFMDKLSTHGHQANRAALYGELCALLFAKSHYDEVRRLFCSVCNDTVEMTDSGPWSCWIYHDTLWTFRGFFWWFKDL